MNNLITNTQVYPIYVKYKFSKWHVPLLAAYETRDMLYKEISF